MKAIEYSRYGGTDALELRDVPAPVPQENELLVRVHSAGLNPVDWKILQGQLRIISGSRMPRRAGAEFAGWVEAVGGGAKRFAVGDAVVAAFNPFRSRQGAFAERVTVPESSVVRVPASLPLPEAAALCMAGVSALDCLRRLGGARSGQRVLIIGASGGVGSFCVQLAHAWGLHVTAVCRDANADFVRDLGAHEVVAYDRVDPLQAREPFNLIVDAAARFTFGKCAHLLTADGVYVNTLPGPRGFFDAIRTRLFGRRRARMLMVRLTTDSIDELVQLAAERKIIVPISHRLPLEQARAGFELSMTGHVRGKIVVSVDGA